MTNACAPIRIARVIMNMGVPASFLKEPRWEHKWQGHKAAISEMYHADPAAYVRRISSISEAIQTRECPIAVFPACILVLNANTSLSNYTEALPAIPWLFTGSYNLDAPRGESECALILRSGRVILNSYEKKAYALRVECFSVITAISSTIAEARNGDEIDIDEYPRRMDEPTVLLDMGHHQYGPRYLRNTLRTTTEAVSHRAGQSAALLLAYWKHLSTKPTSDWTWEVKSRLTKEREYLPVGTPGMDDLLDVFEVALEK